MEPDGQRLIAGKMHMLIDQKDRFLTVAKGKFLIYRVERHRFQVVSTAFIKLRAMIGVDLLVFEVQLIGLGLTDVMQQGYNGDGFHLFGRE